MSNLHPDFRLDKARTGDHARRIFWKNRQIGITRPLSELRRATARSCFIVASGPSVQDIDSRRLRGQTCFAVNGSIALFSEPATSPEYYVVTDRKFVKDRFALIRAAIDTCPQCIFTFRVFNELCEREPALLARDNLFLIEQLNEVYGLAKLSPARFDRWAERQAELIMHEQITLSRGWVGFSRAIQRGTFSGQTVVFTALQIAYSLGFRRVFLLGMDLGGDQGLYKRFYENTHNAVSSRLDDDYEPYILPSFEIAAKLRLTEGFEVYNLSAQSRLPAGVIPKISFAEALDLVHEDDALAAAK